jgi:hypothetical protein
MLKNCHLQFRILYGPTIRGVPIDYRHSLVTAAVQNCRCVRGGSATVIQANNRWASALQSLAFLHEYGAAHTSRKM